MGWRETAKLYDTEHDSKAISAQLDQMEPKLKPGEWVQLAGMAMKIQHGYQTLDSALIVYMVTTSAIYGARQSMFGKWKDMTPVAVKDIPRYEIASLGSTGRWAAYIGETPKGELEIRVRSGEHAEAIAQAVKDAYMHQTQGFPLFAPGSPEARGNDRAQTARKASETTAAQLKQVVTRFRAAYEQGVYDGIWAERCAFGDDIGEDRFDSQSDWYWFNAHPALAGLRLGKVKGPPLSTFCGLADAATNRSDPAQSQATREINERYHGS